MKYIGEKDVEENLGMKETIDILEEAFESLAEGSSFSRPRERIQFEGTVFNTMPGVFNKYHMAGLKTYIANRKGSHFVVLVFDTRNSDLIAVIEANKLGQIRTGALPAMVTRRMVPNGSHGLCIVGSGYQAETQLEGMLNAFDLDSITVYSRTFGNAEKFARRMSDKFKVDIKAHEQITSALRDATIVNSITDSNDPIFSRKDLGDEYHVNLCGGNLPMRREAAEDVMLDSDMIVVEDVEQALRESGEIIGLAERHPEKKMVQLVDLMKMDRSKYSSLRKTVFKSMGIGLEDVAAAYALFRNMKIL